MVACSTHHNICALLAKSNFLQAPKVVYKDLQSAAFRLAGAVIIKKQV